MDKQYSLDIEIKKLEDNKSRHLNILALFFAERRNTLDLRNYAQYQAAIKRHCTAAKALVPFYDDQILNAVKKANEFVPVWTLETLLKILTK